MISIEKLKYLIENSIFLTQEGKDFFIKNIKDGKYNNTEIEDLIEYFKTTDDKLNIIKKEHISKISEQVQKVEKIMTKIEKKEGEKLKTMNRDQLYEKAVKIKNLENKVIKNKKNIYEAKTSFEDIKDIGKIDDLIQNI